MANTININIKNCCCCPGSATGTEQTGIVPVDQWPDPSSPTGIPDGYYFSDIPDRQCKVAVVIYEWIYGYLNVLVTTVPGNWFINFMNSSAPSFVKKAVTAALLELILAVFPSLATFFTIDPTDFATWSVGTAIAIIMYLYTMEAFTSATITIPLLQDILDKMPDYRDRIICEIAQSENAAEVYTRLEKVLDDELGMTDGQRQFFFSTIPPEFLSLLYWGADWWTELDDNVLPVIAETCCGLLEPGQPLLPGSITRCEASNYVLAQLLQLLQNTGTYVNYYFNSWYDLQLDFEQEAYDDIVKNINDIAPRKIRETAYNLTQFERYLAKYVTDGWLSWNPLENYLDTTWSDLADYLELNAEDVICGLFTSLNAAQAATVLTDETDAFLAASTLSETTQSYVKTALLGIISSEGDFIKLLTTQDSDILGFTLTYECDGCGWVDPGEEWTYDQVNDWWYIYGQCSSDVPAGNEQSGDGEADEVHAGPYQIAYHQVTFSGKTIGANAVLNCNYKSLSGAYGNYQFGLLINGEWITGLGFSAGQGSDVWVWVGLDLSAYQGDTLSGVRFGFTSSTGGHTFGVDGWRARNIPGGV